MSLLGWLTKELSGFRGAWTRLDQIQARPERASVARNVRYEPGRVRSRDGYTNRVAVAGKVSSLHQWVTSSLNRVIFFEGGATAKLLDLTNNAIVTLFSQAGRGVQVSESGDKAFIATFTDTQGSAGKVRISLPLISGGQIDTAFAPPWTDVPVVTDTGSGQVTEGVHKFGYIVETRTSFTGRPGPVSAGIFTPVSFTVAAGGRAIALTLTANTPADTARVHPIMTRQDNHDRWYYVPDASVAVPGGATAWVISMPINFSDEQLADGAEEANDQLDALTDSVGGAPPINVSSVASYGRRQVYIADNKAYFSDIDDFQYITEARHVVQTPGQRRIVTSMSLRGSHYLFGPGWTHEVSDNGGTPITWAAPTEVSGAIGTPSILGVEWRTAGDYGWVASQAGLFRFTGQYEARPISYYQTPEWERINWAVPYAVQVRDDYLNQRVLVAAALDANTEASHLLVWDYARGFAPEEVDFSLDNFGSGNFSSLGVVQVPTTLDTQVWIGPRQAGVILASQQNLRTDYSGLLIAAYYETGLALTKGDKPKRLNRFGGIDYAIEGAGTINVSFFSLDRLRQATVTSTLLLAPGLTFERKFSRVEENMTVSFAVYVAGEWFDLSALTVYWKPYATNYANV